MNVLIFNGCSDYKPETTGRRLSGYFQEQLAAREFSVTPFHISEAQIPFFDLHETQPPAAVREMCDMFLESDLHIWMTPLYHGGMTGVMKNCLDWLELTARLEKPYLTDKVVGLVAWADGGQAMQGINAMDAVAKALRAWVVPYSVPLVKNHLYSDPRRQVFTAEHTRKLDRLVALMVNARRMLLSLTLCLLFLAPYAQEGHGANSRGTSGVTMTGKVTRPL
ncbi:MAG TPA: NAD(P)H-dependent oxidoreductase [Puia sp.]|nr:NAD(P)H-dependent oxidoreductase [Puia sp.]